MDERMTIGAFEAGWLHGAEHGEASAREADELLRVMGLGTGCGDVAAFCHGSEDGARGDTWRLASYLLAAKGVRS